VWLTSAMAEGLPDLNVRFDYHWGTLLEPDAGDEPLALFRRWLADAQAADPEDFNAMVVATVGGDGQPAARTVLLRDLDDEGRFRFFTNRESRKGREIARQPRVGLLFNWLALRRQVRVDGVATVLDDAASDAYFASRPRESRLAAWASEQSQVIEGRGALDAAMAAAADRFAGDEVHRPAHWGGYAVAPNVVEFWQGRPNRLHDRIRFRREGGGWVRERLAP